MILKILFYCPCEKENVSLENVSMTTETFERLVNSHAHKSSIGRNLHFIQACITFNWLLVNYSTEQPLYSDCQKTLHLSHNLMQTFVQIGKIQILWLLFRDNSQSQMRSDYLSWLSIAESILIWKA